MIRFRIQFLIAVASSWAGTGVVVAQPFGLESRAPIGAYLNGVLPSAPQGSGGGWTAVPAFPNLTFEDPVAFVAEPRSNRVHVVGRRGTIHFLVNDSDTAEKKLLLDLSATTQEQTDSGLLGLVFHPDFGLPGSPHRGYFYAYYQYSPMPVIPFPGNAPGYNRLSRFTVPDGWFDGSSNPAEILTSEVVLMNQFDRFLWHNGGALLFGEDGFLYFTNGDEGGHADDFSATQKINSGLFSGVMRIDVNQDPTKSHPIRRQPVASASLPMGWSQSFTTNYYIPNDNPWVDPNGTNLEEFWAIGLRNPHRMSLDPVTGRIWLGDVGEELREEVDLIEKGGNYQWAYQEGTAAGPKAKPSSLIGVDRPPLYDYGREAGDLCVIGGYVYRGTEHAADLGGRYIFGDNVSGRIWTLDYDGVNPPNVEELFDTGWPQWLSGLSSFGVDHNQELFLCKMGVTGSASPGNVFRLARTGSQGPPPPALLSQTGAFVDLATLTPSTGLIPYTVNSPLWSDGAFKQRWIAVPHDGAPYGADETIGFTATGPWSFPAGTVFIKHFELPIDDTTPDIRTRLETRFLIRDENNGVFGFTYKWRSDQSDADLVPVQVSEEIVIETGFGPRTQTWMYPGPNDCLTCHTPNAGHVLGVKTSQLNGDYLQPLTGRIDNQLRAWNHAGLLATGFNEADIPGLARLTSARDATAPAEHRVRSYLDANCSHCHRPNGVRADFDARFDTPLNAQGLISGTVRNNLGISGAVLIAPENPAQSVLFLRDSSNGPVKMPPLARHRVDDDAMAQLVEWINSLSSPESTVVPQAGWTLHAVDSEELVGEDGRAINAFDGDTETFWHTQWYNGDPTHPHTLDLNLGAVRTLSGFRVLPRQDGLVDGGIANYEFYVSPSPGDWGLPVATGTFGAGAMAKEVLFAPKAGQYVRLRALSAVDGQAWTSLAELNVLESGFAGPSGLLRVLCLGDSITQGGFGLPSYRDPLVRLIRGENISGANPSGRVYPIDFIGSLHATAGATANPFNSAHPTSLGYDPQHEGHFGWSADELLEGNPDPAPGSGSGALSAWLTGYTPDVVLLHVGTIDAGIYAETEGEGGIGAFWRRMRTTIGDIIDTLHADNPDIFVALATIIPGDYANYAAPDLPPNYARDWEAATDAINAFIADVAAAKNLEAGREFVSVVDLHTGFDPATMLADPWNPNAAGEAFIASRWYQMIRFVIESLPTPEGTIDSPVANVTIAVGESVTFAATAGDPNQQLPLAYRWTFGGGAGISDAAVEDPGAQRFDQPGTYIATFTVTNAEGISDPTPATRTITVTSDAPLLPPDGAIHTPTNDVTVTVGDTLIFGGAVNVPNANDPFSYHWNFGPDSGIPPATAKNPSAVTFSAAGTHTVEMTVKDSTGLADPTPATRTITVEKAVASLVLSNLSQTYDGTPRNVTMTTDVANLGAAVTYDGSPTPPTNAGIYAVSAAVDDPNYEGNATASLTIAPRLTWQQTSPLTVIAGSITTLGLTVDGMAGAQIQWQRQNAQATWVDLPGATGAAYSISSTQQVHAGNYRAVVIGAGQSTASTALVLTVEPAVASEARLLNLSTRGLSQTGDKVLIPGFVIGGTGTKRLLIRAVGPTLAAAPINFTAPVVPDPTLSLQRFDPVNNRFDHVAANDDWMTNVNATAIADTAARLSAFALKSPKEAALLIDLPAGQYSVIARDGSDTPGVAIVELYDADTGNPTAQLINISNRGFSGSGGNVMIPGFVVSPGGPKTLLLRVVGPTLAGAPYNVADTMANPKLVLYRTDPTTGLNTEIFSQDDWGSSSDASHTAQVARTVSAFPLISGSADAAAVVTLEPGTYSLHGQSSDGTGTGVVLVEAYVVP